MSRLRDRVLRAMPLGTAAITGAVTAAFLRDDHTRLRTGLGPELLPAAFVLDGLDPRAWQFVTYAFIHADRAHLYGNLPLLALGGVLTELRLGLARTIAVFVGIVAVVGVVFQRLDGRDLCGASGAGLGLCALAATLWLRARDHRWLVRLAPMLLTAPLLAVTELRPALLGHADPGALAHLTGVVAGVVAGLVLRARVTAPPRAPAPGRHASPLVIAAMALAPLTLALPLSYDRAWPVAFVAIVPWIVVSLAAPRFGPWLAFAAVMPAYASMHLAIGHITWMFHPICAAFFGFALVATGYVLREARRRTRLPLVVLVAPLWTAGEMVRANVLIAPWHRLATALHAQVWALQVCDLAGISALTFALAASSAAVAAVVLRRAQPDDAPRAPSVRAEVLLALAVWAFVALYGAYRQREARTSVREGPRVMVLASDVAHDRSSRERLSELAAATREALRRDALPDLIAWPEAVVDADLDSTFVGAPPTLALAVATLPPRARTGSEAGDLGALQRRQALGRATRDRLALDVAGFGVPTLLGAVTLSPHSPGWRRYNSALLIDPDPTVPMARHDKTDLFPVYEAVPFGGARVGPPRWLHGALRALRAGHPEWPDELDPGDRATAFHVAGESFASPICFEAEHRDFEMLPGLAGRDRPGFWVNIANDAWGRRGDDTVRAFRFDVFRAVEARVGIARSTNAGVTAFVSPSGEVYAVAGGPGAAAMPRDERALRQGANAVAVTRRVRLDRRRSIYVATRGLTDDALLGLWWCALAWSLWSAGRRRRSPGLLRSPLTW